MDNQVDEVKARTDIVSVIGERIELKKAGRNFKANCPFHGEKTASFMVSPELQIFKCFGCGEGGDAFSFLEKYEGMEFPEALKYLADKAGIKLKRTNFGQASEKEKMVEINTQTLRFYNYLLLDHPVGKKALNYLTRDRGLKPETIKEFQLGYSPDNSYAMKQFLVTKKKFDARDVEKAGIGIVRGANVYDRFSGRVVFPLFDHRGNPVGFAGRIMPGGREDTAKYINSPETPVYHKSNILYALNITKGLIKKKKIAIVVEGELDAISSYQAGVKNVVAIKGSALTEEQTRLLSRFAPKFILALDSDLAGDAAARRGLSIASKLGVEIKVAKITDYKDPDEAARGNPESYKKDLINAEGVWDYLIDSVFTRNDVDSGAGKAKISKELTPILAEIDDKIVQAHYVNIVARKLGVPLEAVSEQISKVTTEAKPPSLSGTPQTKETSTRRQLLEERLLALAFQTDPKKLLGGDIDGVFDLPLNTRLLEEYKKFAGTKKAFDASAFSEKLPAELFEGFAKMVLLDEREQTADPESLEKELDLVKKELKILRIKENLKALALKMRELEEKGDKDKLLKVQKRFDKMAGSLSVLDEEGSGGIILGEK